MVAPLAEQKGLLLGCRFNNHNATTRTTLSLFGLCIPVDRSGLCIEYTYINLRVSKASKFITGKYIYGPQHHF